MLLAKTGVKGTAVLGVAESDKKLEDHELFLPTLIGKPRRGSGSTYDI